MGRWRTVGPATPLILSPWFTWPPDRLTTINTVNTSAAWGTANLALYFPIEIPETVSITKLWWQNGTTATGNVDCGIYDEEQNRLVSTGSTAQTGTSVVQSVDITDVTLVAGLYYFALAASSGSSTFWVVGSSALATSYGWSVYRQTSAFALPNPATFATTKVTASIIPKFGALVGPRVLV